MNFYPGDIVKYGFGQMKNGKYPCHEIVCVIRPDTIENRYVCLFVQGDWSFEDQQSICLDEETDLLFTFHPEKHRVEVKKSW